MQQTLKALAETSFAISPWAPAPKPSNVGEVDAAFLTKVLAATTPGAVAESVTRLDGTSGTTDRNRLGIQWNRVGLDAGLPASVFIKSTPLNAKNRTMVAALDMAVNEVKFYEQIRPQLDDSIAPKSYFAHAGHGARHLLVLEDLEAAGATFPFSIEEITLPGVEAIMRTLAKVHAQFWNSPRLASDLPWIAPESARPGFPLLLWQFRKVRKTILNDESVEIPPAARRMAEFANQNDKALHAKWEQGPQTMLHGDSHIGNTYLKPDGTAGLLDWQVIHRGPGLREVSYMMTHSTPADIRRGNEEKLLRAYLDTLEDEGVDDAPTFDQAWEALRFFAFDAWDSIAICKVWPGLQPPDRVELAFAAANSMVEDLEVDKAIKAALA
ncbi:ecdysteroid 22-kinase family protein [Gordonia metallireducens]|uniref:ecdysteroid 22-kinase family protein n=1 Tax=Gordonia metallireducens TaxID=2897779 RepID=UPI001E5B087B|nr:ecdysteroid 22-kinase family protein [Gordonia metallireducens]